MKDIKVIDIYKSGKLDEILDNITRKIHVEPLLGMSYNLVVTESKSLPDMHLHIEMINEETNVSIECENYVDTTKNTFSLSILLNETTLFKAFYYYDEPINLGRFDEKKKEYCGMTYKTPTFSIQEQYALNALLGKELGFPVTLHTDERMKAHERGEYLSNEVVTFKKNYYSFCGQCRESLGVFGRIFEKVQIIISANDSFSIENKLYFGVNLNWQSFDGGRNGHSFPLLNGGYSIYFDKVTRTWHPSER